MNIFYIIVIFLGNFCEDPLLSYICELTIESSCSGQGIGLQLERFLVRSPFRRDLFSPLPRHPLREWS